MSLDRVNERERKKRQYGKNAYWYIYNKFEFRTWTQAKQLIKSFFGYIDRLSDRIDDLGRYKLLRIMSEEKTKI